MQSNGVTNSIAILFTYFRDHKCAIVMHNYNVIRVQVIWVPSVFGLDYWYFPVQPHGCEVNEYTIKELTTMLKFGQKSEESQWRCWVDLVYQSLQEK